MKTLFIIYVYILDYDIKYIYYEIIYSRDLKGTRNYVLRGPGHRI